MTYSMTDKSNNSSEIYLMNTTIVDPEITPLVVRIDEISIDEAVKILSNGFISAVGHEATAQFLAKLFGINIPTNRAAVKLKPGDRVVALKLQGRLPEGKVLSEAEMQAIPYKLYLLTVQSAEVSAVIHSSPVV